MKFYEFIKNNSGKRIDVYCDMDGVIAEYDIGNFDYNDIRPLKSTIKKLENLINDGVNVYILSICRTDKIVNDKKVWFSKHMPFFNIDNAYLISKEDVNNRGVESCELKSRFLKNNINSESVNIVIDDDNGVIKYLMKNNPEVVVFQDSSLVD